MHPAACDEDRTLDSGNLFPWSASAIPESGIAADRASTSARSFAEYSAPLWGDLLLRMRVNNPLPGSSATTAASRISPARSSAKLPPPLVPHSQPLSGYRLRDSRADVPQPDPGSAVHRRIGGRQGAGGGGCRLLNDVTSSPILFPSAYPLAMRGATTFMILSFAAYQ